MEVKKIEINTHNYKIGDIDLANGLDFAAKINATISEVLGLPKSFLDQKPRTATELSINCTSPHTAGRAVDMKIPQKIFERMILKVVIIITQYKLNETKGKSRRKIRRTLRKLRKQV